MPKRNKIIVLIITLILIIGIVLVAFWRYNKAEDATVKLDIPKTVKIGEMLDVPVKIDTAGKTINAAEVYLTFDPEAMKVESLSKENSVFELWITGEPKFSNEKGEISFAGGLPTPGFSGEGQIGSVKITLLRSGKQQIKFDSRTRALLNDGQGSALPLNLDTIVVKVGR